MNELKGVLFVLVGAVCFSIKSVLIKLAYHYSVDPVTLLTLRMGFSLPFFLAVPLIYRRKVSEAKIGLKDYFYILLLSILGYYVASIFDFWGLEYVPAGLERLILFIYPTIVVLLSAVFLKKAITQNTVVALLCTYFGIVVIFSDTHFAGIKNVGLGAFYIFISAFTYASYLVGGGRMIPRIGSVLFNSYSMIVASLAIIVHFAIVRPCNIFELQPEVYYFGLALAIISSVIPTFLIAEGINLIGPSKSAIVASVGPVITIFLGYLVLGESITLIESVGTIFVLGGVIFISYKK